MSDAAERLWALLEPYLAAEGLELDDLELVGHGRGRVLRLTVDSPGGVDLDRIAEASRNASRLLDAEEILSAPYTLEVTSPGLERRLRRPAHYVKAEGREVVVKTKRPVEGRRVHQGVLAAIGTEGFEVDTEGRRRHVRFEEVSSARTVYRWERPAKPGGR